jgi:hypothetical protein
MGFNKRYIQELEVLKERRKEYNSDKEFLNAVVGKSDALIGPKESMDYLDSLYEKIKSLEERERTDGEHTRKL